ncbi:MAG TPA: YqzL family protein [Candidatus Ornithomonoglobus intestinigallinarum]|uniref:YqzL family protein n=1 Tax=Candidatus Ornithomonoglobus intestinigallinarum TaxID=2840894 RepID=A0A9D1H1E6_9FIRM|nr:YqzL family protein [Candidatus Ornithomonoglobus intestinigallinarum]
MELIRNISWEAFIETGDIEAYLIYKSVSEKIQKADADIWESSKSAAL